MKMPPSRKKSNRRMRSCSLRMSRSAPSVTTSQGPPRRWWKLETCRRMSMRPEASLKPATWGRYSGTLRLSGRSDLPGRRQELAVHEEPVGRGHLPHLEGERDPGRCDQDGEPIARKPLPGQRLAVDPLAVPVPRQRDVGGPARRPLDLAGVDVATPVELELAGQLDRPVPGEVPAAQVQHALGCPRRGLAVEVAAGDGNGREEKANGQKGSAGVSHVATRRGGCAASHTGWRRSRSGPSQRWRTAEEVQVGSSLSAAALSSNRAPPNGPTVYEASRF